MRTKKLSKCLLPPNIWSRKRNFEGNSAPQILLHPVSIKELSCLRSYDNISRNKCDLHYLQNGESGGISKNTAGGCFVDGLVALFCSVFRYCQLDGGGEVPLAFPYWDSDLDDDEKDHMVLRANSILKRCDAVLAKISTTSLTSLSWRCVMPSSSP